MKKKQLKLKNGEIITSYKIVRGICPSLDFYLGKTIYGIEYGFTENDIVKEEV